MISWLKRLIQPAERIAPSNSQDTRSPEEMQAFIEEIERKSAETLSREDVEQHPAIESPESAELVELIRERIGPNTASLVERYVRWRVKLEVSENSEDLQPSSSYLAGYPFVSASEDFTWPVDRAGNPMTFLAQINFAEMPKLEGFPEEGLLQWWIASSHKDYIFGLDYSDDSTGREGLLVKFYPASELSESSSSPYDVLPVDFSYMHDDPYPINNYNGPLESIEPSRFTGKRALSLPCMTDEGVTQRLGILFSDVEEVFGWGQLSALEPHSQFGGYPNFVQGDPRELRGPGALLFQLDDDSTCWGDAGSAQLFGDLEAIRRGDVSSCWWDWACS